VGKNVLTDSTKLKEKLPEDGHHCPKHVGVERYSTKVSAMVSIHFREILKLMC
jgi:hypothetical protein